MVVCCLQAVQKLVLAELCAADRVPPLVHASHRGRSHRFPVQQGSGGIGDGHVGASARDRHVMWGTQVVVVAEKFVVLQRHGQKQTNNIIRFYRVEQKYLFRKDKSLQHSKVWDMWTYLVEITVQKWY